MSHFSELKTQYKDQDCLVQALVDIGIKKEHVEIFEKAVQLGGMDAGAKKMAHVVIRKAHVPGYSYNDIGFMKTEDGTYTALLDDMSQPKAWKDKLAQRYNLAVDIKKAKNMGYTVTQTPLKDGSIKLLLRR